MSTRTTTAHREITAHRRGHAPRHSACGVLLSECVKFWSLRSSRWCLATLAMVQVGLCALTAPTIGKVPFQVEGPLGLSGSDTSVNAFEFIVAGAGADAFVVAVLGILVVAGEYSSGHIRSTFLAVPKRLPVLWAKSVVVALSVFLVAIVSFAISYIPVLLVLLSNSMRITPFTIGAIAPLLGAAVYLALISVFSLAVGVCVRSMAGGLAVVCWDSFFSCQ